MQTSTDILIIGAGPAGLALAAQLKQADLEFTIIEKSQHVGNAWREHYERLKLHTVKDLSHLPGLPFPENYPRYVPKNKLVEYFEHYRQHFSICPVFGTEATAIRRLADGKWLVDTNTSESYCCKHLVVATGVNHYPNRPHLKGEEQFQGEILHSKQYKTPGPFAGKKVLVVGMGNTGAEIALDLAENGAASTTIAVRGAVNIVPLELNGRPTQVTALMLAKLPNWLGDRIGSLVRKITMGDLPKYNLPYPAMPPAKQLRELGKTPVVDLGTADMIRAGKIKVINAGIDHLEEKTVCFEDGNQENFDTILLATGYKANIQQIIEGAGEMVDDQGWPKFVIGEDTNRGLYFIGFDNYTPGGILGVINRDAKIIQEHLTKILTASK
ncbi:MAG TPA: NAD(P)/FAD-dependent oxidoreductase [Saprospiraceae bacterium]|nr:NAD(P)/FAD-dependent oxidoreductase [Saprospiraceae bacterium]